MKKIKLILILILVLVAVKSIGYFVKEFSAIEGEPDQHELLRKFVTEFAVNNENFNYPIKINEETYLISRTIKDEGQSMFVVENYRITAPITADSEEMEVAKKSMRQQVRNIFCGSLEERDRLFNGYSSVGIIQNISDSNNKKLFSVKVEKSQC